MKIIIQKYQPDDLEIYNGVYPIKRPPQFYYVKTSHDTNLIYRVDNATNRFAMSLLEEKLKAHFASVVVDPYSDFYFRFTLDDKADAAFLELQFDHTKSSLQLEIEI